MSDQMNEQMNEWMNEWTIEWFSYEKWLTTVLHAFDFKSLGQIANRIYMSKNRVSKVTYILIALLCPFPSIYTHMICLVVKKNVKKEKEETHTQTHSYLAVVAILQLKCAMCSTEWKCQSILFIIYIYRVIRLFSSSISDNFFLLFLYNDYAHVYKQSIKPLCSLVCLVAPADRSWNGLAVCTDQRYVQCLFNFYFIIIIIFCWLTMHFTHSI